MRGSFGRSDLARGFVAWGAAALVACGSPGSQRIVGPDGSPMAHVHCGSDQGSCFRIAGELCPHGYDFRPVLSGSDGNFLVRCHAVSAVSAPQPGYAPAAPPPAPVAATPARPVQAWPPTPEPAPPANPWPAPATSAAATRTGVASTPPGELDLGY